MWEFSMVSELNDFIHGLRLSESEAGKYETCKGVEAMI